MPEFIRVRFKDSKTEQTIVAPHELDEESFTVLKEDAVNENGDPLPPKFPAQDKTGQKAATAKETD